MPTITGATRMIKYIKNKKQRKKRKTLKHAYLMRKKVLSIMGFKSYSDYLNSDEWKSIRSRKLSKYPQCICCKNPSSQIHHLSYALIVMSGGMTSLLAAICNDCHKSIEYSNGEKITLGDANHKLFKMAAANGNWSWARKAFSDIKKVPHPSDFLGLKREKRT